MRKSALKKSAHFRLSPAEHDAASAQARAEGLTLSAFIRRAVVQALPVAASSPFCGPLDVAPNGALGPEAAELFRLAADGDLEAQRALFQICFDSMCDPAGHPLNAQYIATEGALIGRLIAARGKPEDIRRLAGVLVQGARVFRSAGRPECGDHMISEAISICEQLAENGDDVAAMCSQAMVRDADQSVLDEAKRLRSKARKKEEV